MRIPVTYCRTLRLVFHAKWLLLLLPLLLLLLQPSVRI